MKISEEGKSLIKKFEGCKLEAYLCSAGVPTIAFGRTKNVKIGDTCTQEQADAWLEEELEEYTGYVNDAVKVDLTQNQFDALTAWTYNLGPTNLNSSTMLTKINEKDWDEVPQEMRKWVKANGKTLPGLERRRLAESMLFDGDPNWHEV